MVIKLLRERRNGYPILIVGNLTLSTSHLENSYTYTNITLLNQFTILKSKLNLREMKGLA